MPSVGLISATQQDPNLRRFESFYIADGKAPPTPSLHIGGSCRMTRFARPSGPSP
ncbi:hypothetical protein KCP74_22760 [Salmonella enterica subsp. enterica]|nr:hypothetical protein KCP74_22760 [Salmonella enterica subsp. enterica]